MTNEGTDVESESFKSLAWLLVWGALFYFMMRRGCGAHMMGGHGHGGHGDATPRDEEKDPVCGMPVDPKSAGGAAVRDGRTYYFCSASCREKFEKAPEKYSGAADKGAQHRGGHSHG